MVVSVWLHYASHTALYLDGLQKAIQERAVVLEKVIGTARYQIASMREFTETTLSNTGREVEHPLLGAWLAEHWRLPPLLHAAIRDHHEALDPNSPHMAALEPDVRTVVEIVALADHIANAAGMMRIPGAEKPDRGIPPHLYHHLKDENLEQLIEEIMEKAESAREFVAM